LGVPADEALRGMAARSRSEDLRYFVIAVLLQRETGGNLAEVLDNISGLVRQRHQLRQSVRALSAEGRLSAWILGILPFALAGVISFINPDLMSLLWTDPAGRLLCGTAIFMMAIGIFLMRQIVRVRA
jgi:tight adherence protein B